MHSGTYIDHPFPRAMNRKGTRYQQAALPGKLWRFSIWVSKVRKPCQPHHCLAFLCQSFRMGFTFQAAPSHGQRFGDFFRDYIHAKHHLVSPDLVRVWPEFWLVMLCAFFQEPFQPLQCEFKLSTLTMVTCYTSINYKPS